MSASASINAQKQVLELLPRLESFGVLRHFQPEDVIIAASQIPPWVGIIRSGQVRIEFAHVNSPPKIINRIGAGDMLGYSHLCNAPTTFTVIAEAKTEVFQLPLDGLEKLRMTEPALLSQVYEKMIIVLYSRYKTLVLEKF
jgi:CRP-like cAMP-binding protein